MARTLSLSAALAHAARDESPGDGPDITEMVVKRPEHCYHNEAGDFGLPKTTRKPGDREPIRDKDEFVDSAGRRCRRVKGGLRRIKL